MMSLFVVRLEAVLAIVTTLIVAIQGIASVIVFVMTNDDDILLLWVIWTESHGFGVSSYIHADHPMIR